LSNEQKLAQLTKLPDAVQQQFKEIEYDIDQAQFRNNFREPYLNAIKLIKFRVQAQAPKSTVAASSEKKQPKAKPKEEQEAKGPRTGYPISLMTSSAGTLAELRTQLTTEDMKKQIKKAGAPIIIKFGDPKQLAIYARDKAVLNKDEKGQVPNHYHTETLYGPVNCEDENHKDIQALLRQFGQETGVVKKLSAKEIKAKIPNSKRIYEDMYFRGHHERSWFQKHKKTIATVAIIGGVAALCAVAIGLTMGLAAPALLAAGAIGGISASVAATAATAAAGTAAGATPAVVAAGAAASALLTAFVATTGSVFTAVAAAGIGIKIYLKNKMNKSSEALKNTLNHSAVSSPEAPVVQSAPASSQVNAIPSETATSSKEQTHAETGPPVDGAQQQAKNDDIDDILESFKGLVGQEVPAKTPTTMSPGPPSRPPPLPPTMSAPATTTTPAKPGSSELKNSAASVPPQATNAVPTSVKVTQNTHGTDHAAQAKLSSGRAFTLQRGHSISTSPSLKKGIVTNGVESEPPSRTKSRSNTVPK
jgi:hypothetical protein